jgi:DNA repair exonuclease SbcCD ATPase subunit
MLEIGSYVKLNYIRLKNFMSFKDIELSNLDKYKIIFIMSSNATGKSTLTSEGLYYSFFGRSLRFKKIQNLLSRFYVSGESFANIKLSINNKTNPTMYLDIKRYITGSDRKFEISSNNDESGIFEDMCNLSKVDKLNTYLKSLLEMDENKFSILYLKSPYSGSLFESNSTLLTSITKVQYFSDLRTDFHGIVKDLKSTLNIKKSHIDNQHNLLNSTKERLKEVDINQTEKQDNIKILSELEKKLRITKDESDRQLRRKKQANVNKEKRQLSLNVQQEQRAKIEATLSHKRQQHVHYNKLIKAGKCPTCSQKINKELYSDDLNQIFQDGIKLKNDLDAVQNGIKEIEKALYNINQFQNEIYNIEQKINNEIIMLNNQISQLKHKIEQSEITNHNNTTIIEEIIKNIDSAQKEISEFEREFVILENIYSKLLNKKGEYINKFYTKKISGFTKLYSKILYDFTNGKYNTVTIDLNNYPVFNGSVIYESLSTSERKIVDLAFIIAYVAYLSQELKFKTFILDELLDNIDPENILNILNIIYNISVKYNLQIFLTSNMSDYIISNMTQYKIDHPDTKIINLREKIGLDDEDTNLFDI